MKINEEKFRKWYAECILWLGSLGFQEIYSNHPSFMFREYHWIKDGIRICCIYDPLSENFCFVQNDILSMKFPFAIRSCRYKIGDPKVLEIHEWFKPIEGILKNVSRKCLYTERCRHRGHAGPHVNSYSFLNGYCTTDLRCKFKDKGTDLICKNCKKEIPYEKRKFGKVIRSDGECVSYEVCPFCEKWDCFDFIDEQIEISLS
jgi:hypothetical protein